MKNAGKITSVKIQSGRTDHIGKISGQQIDISEVPEGISFVKATSEEGKTPKKNRKKMIHLVINNKEHMSRPGDLV